MHYRELFEPNDTQYYQLLQRFLRAPGQQLAISTVMVDLDWTKYKATKAFTTLNNDLAVIGGDQPAFLDEYDHGVWHANHVSTLTLQQLGLLYLQRSSLMPVFEYHFFYSQRMTKTDYMEATHFANSVFYAAEKKITKQIATLETPQSAPLITDAEHSIRLQLFQLYYAAYNGLAAPFAELDDQLTQVVAALASVCQTHWQPTQVDKLKIFLAIWLLRIKDQHPINTQLLAHLAIARRPEGFVEAITAHVGDWVTPTETELDYLYSFMVIQQFIPEPDLSQLVDVHSVPLAFQLTADLLQELTATQLLKDGVVLADTGIEPLLFNLNLQLATFYIEPTTFIAADQIGFFQDLYPEFDLLISHFLQRLQDHGLNLTQARLVNLYFSYMFVFIQALRPELLRLQVTVTVDFSQGPLYTDYIAQSLTTFHNANLVVDHHLSEHTDLYLSDAYAQAVRADQVIWQNPPTPSDWAALADQLVALKQAKSTTAFLATHANMPIAPNASQTPTAINLTPEMGQ
ncbi:MAG: hypothetical protein LKJ69_10755 [Lactobacillus sp.]|jgi:hypothetical protein|nr:hypothetical protein [Lactobacillus sp.]